MTAIGHGTARWLLAGLMAAGAAAWLAPTLFWLLLAAAAAGGLLLLGYRHLPVACALWLLLTGATLEMTLNDLVGPAAFQPTIAAVKAAAIVLAMLCALRYGARLDPFNPAFAFLAIFAAGIAHGLYPGLSAADSLRSLAGSVAPFAFGFSRLSRRWAVAMIGMARWIPLLTVAAAAMLDLAGVRPLFVADDGVRLAGLGHPAFLAGICLAAIYAGLVELLRDGRRRELWLLAANALLLLLTGARAPLAYGGAVVLLTLLFAPSAACPFRRRLPLLLGGLALLPLLLVFAGALTEVRVFALLSSDAATSLSGRDQIWPLFEAAASRSFWLGWGIGAGNSVIPQDNTIVQFMHTWAAHNEYLRMRVEGGALGLGLLMVCFALWGWRHTAALRRSDAFVLRLVLLAFAAHAATDNVLISTPACVLFAWVAAVFARGAHEAAAQAREVRRIVNAGPAAALA